MYLLKSSVKNLYHYKSRNIISAILLLIVISISGYAFFVYEACQATADDIAAKFKNRYIFSSQYSLSPDMPIDKDTMNSFFGSEYVCETVISFKSRGVNLIGVRKFDNIPEDRRTNHFTEGQFVIVGWDTSELNEIDEFDMRVMELTEGRAFQNYGEILINDDLAKENMLNVGDKILASSYSGYEGELTIVGLYKLRNDIYYFDTGIGLRNIDVDNISYDTRNLIYSTFDTAYDITACNTIYDDDFTAGKNEENMYNTPPLFGDYYPTFTLNSNEASYINDFENELHKKGLPSGISIMYDRKSSNDTTRTLTVFSSSLFIIYLVFSAIGVVITFFSIIISLRERKYEFAVLTSMGMSKMKICLALCIETFVFLGAIALISVLSARVLAIHILNAFNPELLLWFDITIMFSNFFVTSFVFYVIGLGLSASILYGGYLFKFSPLKLFIDRF